MTKDTIQMTAKMTKPWVPSDNGAIKPAISVAESDDANMALTLDSVGVYADVGNHNMTAVNDCK